MLKVMLMTTEHTTRQAGLALTLVLRLQSLADGFEGLLRRHRRGVEPALEARAWVGSDDIGRVDAHVEAQDERGRNRLLPLTAAPRHDGRELSPPTLTIVEQ